MAEAIGTALARVTSGPPCSESSTTRWAKADLSVLNGLPDRLDDRQLEAVDAIALLPVPPMVPVANQHFTQCMRTLTVLPSRDGDELTAKLRVALYRKHFGHLPEAAWSFLVEHATLECRFFPSPAECKAILERWSRSDGPWRAHQLAQTRAARERQTRFDDLMHRFRMGEVKQAEVDQLPERWKRIAATQGYLREDGAYTLRPVVRWEEQEGVAPPSYDINTLVEGKKAGQRHERTDQ